MRARTIPPFLPAGLLGLFSLLWVSTLTLSPRPGDPVAVLFPPSADGDAALLATAAAGASEILAFGGRPSIILLRSADRDLIHQLHQRGAWLVVRAPLLTDCLR